MAASVSLLTQPWPPPPGAYDYVLTLNDEEAGYQLSAAGRVLAHYHSAIARDPHQPVLAPCTTLDRTSWTTLVGVAMPGKEREHILKSAATRRIKIEG